MNVSYNTGRLLLSTDIVIIHVLKLPIKCSLLITKSLRHTCLVQDSGKTIYMRVLIEYLMPRTS